MNGVPQLCNRSLTAVLKTNWLILGIAFFSKKVYRGGINSYAMDVAKLTLWIKPNPAFTHLSVFVCSILNLILLVNSGDCISDGKFKL
jgi:hypothetical protein